MASSWLMNRLINPLIQAHTPHKRPLTLPTGTPSVVSRWRHLGETGSPPGYGPGTSRNPKIKDHSSTLFFHLLLCLLLPVSGTLSSWKWALTRCWGAGVAPVQQDAADIERVVSYLPHRFRFRQLNYSVVEKRSTHFNIGLWNSLKCI